MNSLPLCWLMVAFRWFVFSNGYIAICAVVMVWSTVQLFALKLPGTLLPFVFTSTLSSYSLHWYLTPLPANDLGTGFERLRWNDRHRRFLLVVLLVSATLSSWFLLSLRSYWLQLVPLVVLTFLYTAPKMESFKVLRRIAVLKTAYLAAIWTYTTAALPLLMATSSGQRDVLLWAAWLANRFLLIYAISLWFDYRDRADDRQSRWLTIVSMLSEPQINRFFGSIVLLFAVTSVVLYMKGAGEWVIICVSLPMLLVVLTAQWIAKRSSDYWYYVYLDGLMMLTGLLLPIVPLHATIALR